MATHEPAFSPAALGDHALAIAQDLIRFDTTNTGDDAAQGERAAAEYVIGLLQDLGYEPFYAESEPRRGSVVLRLEGADAARPALVLHGHLDVVPAATADWTADPFGAELRDGCLWGRGAVDMKDMDAMMLAVVADWTKRGVKPPRDIVLAFLADEEAGGKLGAHWLVDHHPDLFAGATEAVGEVGGFSTWVAGRRVYLIQTAEKGLAWLKLVATGTAGHGSAINPDNAVARLAAAVSAIAGHAWPMHLTPTMQALLRGVADLTGLPLDLADPASVRAVIDALGPAQRFVAASTATAVNATGLTAGYKVNVVPGEAAGTIDMRPLPGDHDAAWAKVRELAGPGVAIEAIHDDVAVENPFPVPLTEAMAGAIGQADPSATVLPYLLSAGTDAKAFSRLGIHGYGFVPLALPPDFDFTAMFHGVDERVPVDSLTRGTAVLADFLLHC
ncbi:MAG: M20/M25/M40 family metallo-hydrolase [Bifidobacteriaceae bacterium]|jgi:acetylornithine deacetylase/succinyl-diaminopimelate desuccinylase-like protein|nr:M20/M25/M40 family metallo-hydrolase [Bifidobacteriaceae bacterium]